MIANSSAPGTASMALLCQEVSDFNPTHKNVYCYEVLGGLHTYMAKSQLIREYSENPFYKMVIAEVYLGLTDEEALRLAQRHNINSHFVHIVIHRDLVGVAHAHVVLYSV